MDVGDGDYLYLMERLKMNTDFIYSHGYFIMLRDLEVIFSYCGDFIRDLYFGILFITKILLLNFISLKL
jgi:hypothetical protein